MVLRDDVTQKTIDALREEANTPDEFGNFNKDKETVENELKLAEEILYAKNLRDAVSIHSEITNSGTYDPSRGFSGLNA
ncbi:MAG: hypothetical protein HDT22_11220 [Ruminococcus sp.]|nr:hypothetical protein [Ruminococcus sp.]